MPGRSLKVREMSFLVSGAHEAVSDGYEAVSDGCEAVSYGYEAVSGAPGTVSDVHETDFGRVVHRGPLARSTSTLVPRPTLRLAWAEGLRAFGPVRHFRR